jgi:hypothetical protein
VGRKARKKSPTDEQEPHTRPTGSGELAQHSEALPFSSGGKCGGQVAEVSLRGSVRGVCIFIVGYLCKDPERTIRVRLEDEKAAITII